MARGKKKENLTLEEKLEQTLVPLEEQPYEVPKNWCWTKISCIASVIMGQSPSGDSTTDDNVYTPLIGGAADMGELLPKISRYTKEPTKISEVNDLILCIRATLGRPVFSDGEYCLGRGVAAIRSKYLSKEFLRYFYLNFEQYLYDNATGTTFAQVTGKMLENQMIPLPPLEEQKRIVEQIESLFSKLDEVKDKAQDVVDGTDARVASIYHDAFSGKLTQKWRIDNNVESQWKVARFDEVAEIKSNLVSPSEYSDYPHIAPDNIEKRTGVLLEYNTIKEDGVTSGKHRFYPGQILYSKIRPYLSKVVMVDFDGLCSADMYPIEAKGNSRYLLYYMLSDEFLVRASSAGSRSVLPKINQKELSAIKVRITSLEEQNEVVKILDRILPKTKQAKELAESVIDRIDIMKKSILAKAFRGKLGTNSPEEESSIELLKEILNSDN